MSNTPIDPSSPPQPQRRPSALVDVLRFAWKEALQVQPFLSDHSAAALLRAPTDDAALAVAAHNRQRAHAALEITRTSAAGEPGAARPAWSEQVAAHASAQWRAPLQSRPADAPPLTLHAPLGVSLPAAIVAAHEIDGLMERLSEQPAAATALAARMALQVAAVRHDPRPAAQIPEVRLHFALVNAQWPYWLHFLAPTRGNYRLLLDLLAPSSPDELLAQLRRMAGAAVALQSFLGLSRPSAHEHADLCLKALHQALQVPGAQRPGPSIGAQP